MLEPIFLALALGALAVLAAPRRLAPVVALAAMGTSAAFAVVSVRRLLAGHAPSGFGGALILDGPGAVVLMLVLTLGSMAALVSSQTERWPRRFYALLLAFTATMALAATADNLGVLWASVEATTLSSALLVGHRRTREATEAAWKYLILSSTGILFAFVATLVLVLAVGARGEATLSARELTRTAAALDPGFVRLALVLATVGYGTKAGLVPYHFWLPDAHSEAPSPVSALLSGVLLSCALLGLDRFARIADAAGAPMQSLHLTLGALSVIVGGALVLAAHTYKRMLAYSSVENMGIVTFAIGLGSPLALAGAYLHILSHGLAKSLAFFSAGRIHHHLGTTQISKASGLIARTPTAARGLFVGLLALAGLPPFGPFASKLMILAAALPAVAWPYVAALLFGLVLAFAGFMRHTSSMLARLPAGDAAQLGPPIREPWTVPAVLVLLGLASVAACLVGPALVRALLAANGAGAGAVP